MKTLKNLLIPAVVSLSLMTAPLRSFGEDIAKQDTVQTNRIKIKEKNYVDHSLLTNFNTYQLSNEVGFRGKIFDYAVGFSFATKKQEKREVDGLLNFTLSREEYLGRNNSIIPYIILQAGLSDKDAIYQMEKIENPNAKPNFFYQDNISPGLKLKKDISKKLSLGFNIRWMDYFDKRAKNDLVTGVFVSYSPDTILDNLPSNPQFRVIPQP